MMKKETLGHFLGFLPDRLARELTGILRGARCELRELRLRGGGISSVVSDCGTYPLYARLSCEETEEILRGLCHGSLYAYRDSIAAGYVALPGGIRVGVIGEARYDGERVVGVDAVSSLVFRIPTGGCDFADGLHRGWIAAGEKNMLICAPPAGGKTTALRALAALIGRGRGARRVVVVDERCEFDASDYIGATVDVLRGYRRGAGTELAVRTMSPEVLMVDEIASREDALAVRGAIGVGVPVIATTHGTDIADAMRRDYVRALVEDGCFASFTALKKEGGRFVAEPPKSYVC